MPKGGLTYDTEQADQAEGVGRMFGRETDVQQIFGLVHQDGVPHEHGAKETASDQPEPLAALTTIAREPWHFYARVH